MSQRLALLPNAFFCVVSCNGMSSRTVAKKLKKPREGEAPENQQILELGELFEFPLSNDAWMRSIVVLCRFFMFFTYEPRSRTNSM